MRAKTHTKYNIVVLNVKYVRLFFLTILRLTTEIFVLFTSRLIYINPIIIIIHFCFMLSNLFALLGEFEHL